MPNDALRQLYEDDQADRSRQPIDWSVISRRDRERRSEVRRLLAAGELRDEWDYYWAAVVLIHSRDAKDLEDAHTLSCMAFELNQKSLQICAFYALSKDRLLISRNQPQWYGTQKVLIEGKLAIAPLEPYAVTDEERTAMGVPTLEQRYQEIDRINRARAEVRRRAVSSERAKSNG